MRRAIVTSTATVSGVILVLGLKSHPAGAASAGRAAKSISVGSEPGSAATSSAPAPAAGPTSAATPGATGSGATGSATGASRVITGAAADTRFGPVQVKVTFAGTKIAKIDVVQYPSESRRDLEINQFALPVLNQEALAAQSATIDSVSGATYTTDGYVRSLQSAIDQARA